jgi:hypothetical protein
MPPRISTNLKELLAQYLLDRHPAGPHMDAGASEKLPCLSFAKNYDIILLIVIRFLRRILLRANSSKKNSSLSYSSSSYISKKNSSSTY